MNTIYYPITPNMGAKATPSESRRRRVVSHQDFWALPEVVWESLMFYEEITQRPPFLLSRFLPVPIRADGCKSEVGAQIKCQYVGGHLLKRISQITQGRNYAFDVIEQQLALGGIKLLGGEYMLHKLSDDRTRVALTTHFESPYHPRWLCGRVEAVICHAFHRHILTAMRSKLCPG